MVTEENLKRAVKELRKALGENKVLSSPEDVYPYGFDVSHLRKFPDAVVRVYSTEDVEKVLKIANEYEVPIIPRGGGTSLTGGVIPSTRGLILELNHVQRPADRIVTGRNREGV